MRRTFAVLALSILTALPAWAALPPHYQRLAELQAILGDAGVIEAFGISRPVDKIEWIETDHYRVTSGTCRMEVMIVNRATQPGLVGPRRFAVEPAELVCQ